MKTFEQNKCLGCSHLLTQMYKVRHPRVDNRLLEGNAVKNVTFNFILIMAGGRIYSRICLTIYSAINSGSRKLPPNEHSLTKFLYECIEITLCPHKGFEG